MSSVVLYGQSETTKEEAEGLKIGIVIFLSGPAARPYGIPAYNSARMLIDALNCSLEKDNNLPDCEEIPPPYNKFSGIAGFKVIPIFLDENGGDVVTRYENLIDGQNVNLVIGYIVSSNCEKIATVAKKNQTLTIFVNCGTPRVFEKIVKKPKEKPLFRTGAHSTMDSVALAMYVNSEMPHVRTIAGINQNYSWGRDSWSVFSTSMKVIGEIRKSVEFREKLKPFPFLYEGQYYDWAFLEYIKTLGKSVEVKLKLFPTLFEGQYDDDVLALLKSRTEIVHSSFWGSDLELLIEQGVARGLFDRSQVLLTAGESSMCRLADKIPNGTIIGARGTHGVFALKNEFNKWFRETYSDLYKEWPTDPAYHMALAILGVKRAYEIASENDNSTGLPKVEDVIMAFEGLEYKTPSGLSKMALAEGHQGIQNIAYGKYNYDPATNKSTITNVRYYDADCVNPPPDKSSAEWIINKFPRETECEIKFFVPKTLSINCCYPKFEKSSSFPDYCKSE